MTIYCNNQATVQAKAKAGFRCWRPNQKYIIDNSYKIIYSQRILPPFKIHHMYLLQKREPLTSNLTRWNLKILKKKKIDAWKGKLTITCRYLNKIFFKYVLTFHGTGRASTYHPRVRILKQSYCEWHLHQKLHQSKIWTNLRPVQILESHK